MTQNVGITAYGAYLPKLRLDRASIAASHAWAMPGLKGQGKGERTMADWDEDSITMAVEAARDCLQDTDRGTVTGAYLASTTRPFADRQNVGVVAAGLNLGRNITSLDISGSQRAGTSGLIAALRGANDGVTLYTVADTRKAKPASLNEFQFGHGAAALTLGTDGIIANFLGSNTVTAGFVDHFRGSGELWPPRALLALADRASHDLSARSPHPRNWRARHGRPRRQPAPKYAHDDSFVVGASISRPQFRELSP